MALTASDLIESARDYHRDFVQEVIPGPIVLRQLARLEKRLYMAMVDANPERMASVEVFTDSEIVTSLSDPIGLTLPTYILVVSAVVLDDEGGHIPVHIIPKADMPYRPFAMPAAYLEADKIVLVDDRWYKNDIHGWEEYAELRVTLIEAPAALSSPAATLTIPDEAEDALVTSLALFMARRINVTKELPGLVEETDAAVSTLLHSTQARDTTTSWTVRVV